MEEDKKDKSVLINVVDDKGLVIICATLLGMTALVLLGVEGMTIAGNVISGLFGVAVGRAFSKE